MGDKTNGVGNHVDKVELPVCRQKVENGLPQNPSFTSNESETHGADSGSPFLCIGQMMTKRLSVRTTAVIKELVSSYTKVSAKKSTSH